MSIVRPPAPLFTADDAWKEDDLDRGAFGRSVIRLVKDLDFPIAIALRAPWGGGKSLLLDRIATECRRREHALVVARFDAWANESIDPLVGFTAAAIEALASYESKDAKGPLAGASEDLRRGSRKTVKRIVHEVGPVAIAGILAAAGGSPLGTGTIEKGVWGSIKALLSRLTRWFGKSGAKSPEQLSADFRSDLQTAVTAIRSVLGDNGCKLLFLVDELDRCRPDYAVRVLERVKHFYNVRGVVFLIAADQAYLESAVKCVHGANLDAERYLRRMIEFFLEIPNEYSRNYVNSLWDKFNFAAVLGQGEKVQHKHFGALNGFFEYCWRSMSIRDFEHALMRARFAIGSAEGLTEIGPKLIIMACFLPYLPASPTHILKSPGEISDALLRVRSDLKYPHKEGALITLLEGLEFGIRRHPDMVAEEKSRLEATLQRDSEAQSVRESAAARLEVITQILDVHVPMNHAIDQITRWLAGSPSPYR